MTTTEITSSQFIDSDSKRAPSEPALVFAELLTTKFVHKNEYTAKCFTVQGGNKFDRIVQRTSDGHHGSVHAFVDKDGNVYKAAGWAAPAKGIRYSNVLAAVDAADVHGGYLYKR